MRPKLNPTMARAQALLYTNMNHGSIQASMAAAQEDREETIQRIVQRKLAKERDKAERIAKEKKIDAFMDAARARLRSRQLEDMRFEQAGYAHTPEEDILAALGTHEEQDPGRQ